MNSVKTVAVVAVFLGVVYGVYQVINNQEPYVENDAAILDEHGNAIVGPLGVEIDAETLSDDELDAILMGDGSDFDMDDTDMGDSGFSMSFDVGSDEDDAQESSADSPTPPPSSFPAQPTLSANAKASNNFGATPPLGQKSATAPPAELKPPTAVSPSKQPNLPANEKTASAPDDNSFGAKTSAPPNSGFSSQPASTPNLSGLPQPTTGDNGTNQGFSSAQPSAPSNPVGMITNPFAAKAAEIKAKANGAFDKIPNLVQSTKDTARDMKEAATEKVQQADDNAVDMAVDTAANAVADKANQFLVPSKPQLPAAKPDTRIEPSPSGSADLAGALGRARIQIEQGKFREALENLSAYHNDNSLNQAQRKELLNWLDPLAGKVIYSTEHLVTQGHVVRSGETLDKIAAQYQISPQLLFNVNRVNISSPRLLAPGSTLKVVQGPFSAMIDRSSNEMTLFLNKMYAGRFVVTLGDSSPTQAGRFTIKQKSENGHDYISENGLIIGSNDPANPYGKYWLQLDNGAAIHSTADTGNVDDKRGSISLSPIDAEDVYGILTAGSQVIIR